jgi:hypothetical protein
MANGNHFLDGTFNRLLELNQRKTALNQEILGINDARAVATTEYQALPNPVSNADRKEYQVNLKILDNHLTSVMAARGIITDDIKDLEKQILSPEKLQQLQKPAGTLWDTHLVYFEKSLRQLVLPTIAFPLAFRSVIENDAMLLDFVNSYFDQHGQAATWYTFKEHFLRNHVTLNMIEYREENLFLLKWTSGPWYDFVGHVQEHYLKCDPQTSGTGLTSKLLRMFVSNVASDSKGALQSIQARTPEELFNALRPLYNIVMLSKSERGPTATSEKGFPKDPKTNRKPPPLAWQRVTKDGDSFTEHATGKIYKWCNRHQVCLHDSASCSLLVPKNQGVGKKVKLQSYFANQAAFNERALAAQQQQSKVISDLTAVVQNQLKLAKAEALANANKSSDDFYLSDSDVFSNEDPSLVALAAELAESEKFNPELVKGSGYLVPMLIHDSKVIAMYDSGANFSAMTSSLAEKLELDTKDLNAHLDSFLGASQTCLKVTKTSIPVAVTNYIANHRFVIRDFEGLPFDILMGRDLAEKFGIVPTNIPTSFPKLMSKLDVETISPDEPEFVVSDSPELLKFREDLKSFLEPLLAANEAIPVGSFCTDPDATIKFTLKNENDPSLYRRQYQTPQVLAPFVRKQLHDWFTVGTIKLAPFGTRFNMPIFPIPERRDGEIIGIKRLVSDPRPLNAQLVEDDKMEIPTTHDLMDLLGKFMVASKFDLKKSFNQLMVHLDSQPYLAFTFENIQYVHVGCPFGIKIIPSIFQRLMRKLTGGMPFCIVFIDDIIVFSQSHEEHKLHCQSVLRVLNDANLKLNMEKTKLGFTSLDVLGHLVHPDYQSIAQDKLEESILFPKPTGLKSLQSFIGFFNYLRDYIPRFAEIAAPLEAMKSVSSKDWKASWSKDCDNAVYNFRKCVAANVCLHRFDPSLKTFLSTDASNVGIGSVLYQLDETKKKRYIRFFSSALNKAERGYSAVRKELLAITQSLDYFKHYLFGRKFTIETDSRALTFFYTQKKLNPMLITAAETLFMYDFDIVHLPGIQNVLPDSLSRMWPDYSLNVQDNLDLVSFFVDVNGKLDIFDDSVTIPQLTSFLATVNLEELVLVPEAQRQELLEKIHLEGHFGASVMVDRLKTLGKTWPGVSTEAHKWVQSCIPCQKFNISKVGFNPLVSTTASLPMDHIVMDMAGPFPLSSHLNTHVLLVVDVATRFVWLFPLPDDKAPTIARSLLTLFTLFGFPKILQSDRGGHFVAKVIEALVNFSSIDHKLILPYNPRANGLIEIQVRTFKSVLYKRLDGVMASWCILIPSIQYFMNVKVSRTTGSQPFTLMFGRAPNPFLDYSNVMITEPSALEDRLNFINYAVFPGTYSRAVEIAQKNSKKFNARHRILPFPFFKIGSVVLYKDPNITKVTPKSVPRWTPMIVKGVGPGLHYQLASLDGVLLATPVPVNHIKPRPDLKSLANSSKVLEIECILDHRLIDDSISFVDSPPDNFEYLIKWRYVPESHPQCRTWEPAANFNTTSVISEYWSRNQLDSKKRKRMD